MDLFDSELDLSGDLSDEEVAEVPEGILCGNTLGLHPSDGCFWSFRPSSSLAAATP